jgi:hypothetical protein
LNFLYIVHSAKVLDPGKEQIRIRIAHLRNWSDLQVGIYRILNQNFEFDQLIFLLSRKVNSLLNVH